MEIISCGFNASSVSDSKKHFSIFKNFFSNDRDELVYSPVYVPGNILNEERSFDDFFIDLKGRIFRSSRRAAKILPVIGAVAFGIAFSLQVGKNFGKKEAVASPVTIKNAFDSETDDLDGAMTDFAKAQGDLFDSEGNIITENLELKPSPKKISYKQPVSYHEYLVKSGDTIGGITHRFGLKTISTIIAMNNIKNVRALYSGQKLRIPNMDGLVHSVEATDTLDSIAAKYGASVDDIVDVNDLTSGDILAGQELFVPGARLDEASLKKAMGEVFICPLKKNVYRITSRFGPRADPFTGVASRHGGLDMACVEGTPIYAAKSGKITKIGFSSIFGNYVIIDHLDGYQSLYAHMSRTIAKQKMIVSQGDTIGLVGSTGYSTGSHLHFQVYKDSKLVDPETLFK